MRLESSMYIEIFCIKNNPSQQVTKWINYIILKIANQHDQFL